LKDRKKMDNSYIHILLEKYWNCETSADQENQLQDYFSGNNVSQDLQKYIPLFSYKNDEKSKCLSKDFDVNLQKAIKSADKKTKKYIIIKIFAPALRIAVSAMLVAAMGLGIYFIAKAKNETYFAETYNDPKPAIKQATFALDKLSEALNAGEKASKESLQYINDMEIDWISIDSVIQDYIEMDSAISEQKANDTNL